MGSYIKALLLLIVLVVLVTFGIINQEPVALHSYQWKSPSIPAWIVVYGSLILGILIGMIVGINARFAQRKKLKVLQRENRDLKAKVAQVPEEKAVVEAVVEEKETPPEQTDEFKTEFEATEDAAEEEEKKEEEEEKEEETRF